MGIADLLWACPLCGLDRGLRGPSDDATCSRCGTTFERVRGARIRARGGAARGADGGEDVRTPALWVDALPDPASLLQAGEGGNPIRTATVAARFVERWEAVRDGERYLNRIEIFGEPRPGRLELARERLRWLGEGEDPLVWEFGDLRAIQASSRTLQVNGAPHPLASFAFPDDSSFLWEQLVALALGAWYRHAGKGEIVELQPRIVTR